LSKFYLIAKILSAGKNGFVKVQILPGFTKNLLQLTDVFLDFWNHKKKFTLEEILDSKKSVFFKFNNFENDRDVSLLIGRDIYLLNGEMDNLYSEDFSFQNLFGSKVFQNKKLVGIVNDVFETPANIVIEIKNGKEKEILIPFVHSFFDKIDLANKEVFLKPYYGIYNDED
jgi:16S rRNA processing protein RimM